MADRGWSINSFYDSNARNFWSHDLAAGKFRLLFFVPWPGFRECPVDSNGLTSINYPRESLPVDVEYPRGGLLIPLRMGKDALHVSLFHVRQREKLLLAFHVLESGGISRIL
jgi:hypothetical protein